MASSAQLEREAEQSRAQLALTLDELRERITPGQLVDQAVDYAKDSGGGMFVRNLGRQVTGNPLPVALIGAGIAWLMVSNSGRSVASAGGKEAAIDRARRAAIDSAARMGGAGSGLAEDASAQARRATDSAVETASSLYDSARASASDAYDRVADTASRATSTMSGSTSSFGQRTAAASRDFLQFCRSQPLIVGGL